MTYNVLSGIKPLHYTSVVSTNKLVSILAGAARVVNFHVLIYLCELLSGMQV